MKSNGEQNMKWQKFSMALKQAWHELHDGADMPPAIIGFYNGKADIIIISPKCDRDDGLKAAHLLKTGTLVDSITFITDCHMKIMPKESSFEDYKEGQLQKEYQNDASENGVIPAITCIHINPDVKIECECFPYHYHQKKGIPFRWDEDKKENFGPGVTGLIPDALKNIMLAPTILEKDLEENKYNLNEFNFTNDKKHYHMKNALRTFLCDYLFVDGEVLNEPDVEKIKIYIKNAYSN
jgi:hypothetical protein